MSKILIFTNRLVIGGPSSHIFLLIKELQKSHEVILIGGTPKSGEKYDQNLLENLSNPPIILSNFSRKINILNDLFVFIKVIRIIRKHKPDIVHTHTGKPGLIGRIAAKLCKTKRIVHTYHGFLFENYFPLWIEKIYEKLENFLCSISDKIIVLSQSQYNELALKRSICSKEKIHIVHLGIEYTITDDHYQKLRDEFREKYKITEDVVVIGMVGRLTRIKNVDLFLEALEFLLSKKLRLKAFIIGDGEDKKKLFKSAENKLIKYCDLTKDFKDSSLYFTSWYSNILEVYPALDMLVSTSLSEGTPLSLIEAQFSGKAIIASDVGGVSDIVANEDLGVLIPSNDLNLLIYSIEELMFNKERFILMGNNAKLFAQQNFSSKVMVEKTLEVYFN